MESKCLVGAGLLAAVLMLASGQAVAGKPLAPGAQQNPEPAEFRGMLEAQNQWRRKAGVQDLSWSNVAAQQAQSWAGQLVREGCKLRFNPDEARRENYGENLFYAYSSRPYEGYIRTLQQVVDRWGSEAQYYDAASGSCRAPLGKGCGQYTQLVWGDTRYVGCARARCDAAEVWVCNYTPRGNVEGLKPSNNPPPVAERKPVTQCFALAEDYSAP